MTNQWQKGEGWSSVNAYLLPGIPFFFRGTAGAAGRISFPMCTKYFEISNLGTSTDTVRVAITQNGLASNPVARFSTISAGQTRRFDLRVTEIWVSAGSGTPAYEVIAGLSSATGVSPLTGSIDGVRFPHFEGVG